MVWQTTAPDVIDALVAGLSSALPDTAVADGMFTGGSNRRSVLIVGYAPDDDNAVTHELEADDLRSRSSRELYTIQCLAQVSTGAQASLPSARRAAYGLVSAVGAFLAADPRIGKRVSSAQIATIVYRPSQSKGSAVATIQFGIDIDAFTP